MAEEQINFGITKETRSEGTKLFNPPMKLDAATEQFPNKHKYPIGRLVNVVAEPEYDTKNGKQAVIQFVFKGTKGETYTHIEWSQDPTDAKFEEKLAGLNSRIKHILEQTRLSLPEGGIGVGAKNFEEYFKSIADTFNSQTVVVEEKPVKKYYQQLMYVKVVYYKKNLGFPLFPDFLQAATDKTGKPVPCNLTINPTYDKLEPDVSDSNVFANTGGGGGDLSDLPDFN
jgi:hypothetical protein